VLQQAALAAAHDLKGCLALDPWQCFTDATIDSGKKWRSAREK